MASSIVLSDNGVTSGSAGIKSTGGNDGVLLLQTTTAGGVATTAVTVDASQNVGVGVTPSAWGSPLKPAIELPNGVFITSYNGAALSAYFGCNSYYNGTNYIYKTNGYATLYSHGSNGAHVWNIAASGTAGNTISFTQAMTLDASGNLLVGTTTSPGVSGVGIGFLPGFSTSGVSMVCRTGTAANNDNVYFYTSSGLAGYIRTNGTTTTYASVSDERLKENIADANSAVEKVQQIQVRKFDWKSGDGHVDYGFIAQELKVVAPQAVAEGTKENDVWAVDTSMLIPLLTKAIQEQQALITSLTERITALEAK